MIHLVRGLLKLVDKSGVYIDSANPLQVTSSPKTFSTVTAPSRLVVGVVASTILAVNPSRGLLLVQNVGLTIIYLSFGAVNPTASIYHIALKPGLVVDDGLGAILISDEWIGAIQAISSAVGGAVVVTEGS